MDRKPGNPGLAPAEFVKGLAKRAPSGLLYTLLDPPCDDQENFVPVAQWDPTNWPPHIHQPKNASTQALGGGMDQGDNGGRPEGGNV